MAQTNGKIKIPWRPSDVDMYLEVMLVSLREFYRTYDPKLIEFIEYFWKIIKEDYKK